MGSRLRLRPWLRRDRKISSRWPQPPIPAAWMTVWGDPGPRMSYAVERHDNLLIGRITLRNVDERSADVGIYIRPDFWGHGYGSESIGLICTIAFQTMHLQRLRLDVAMQNQRAVNCYYRAGFFITDTAWRMMDDGTTVLFAEMQRENGENASTSHSHGSAVADVGI